MNILRLMIAALVAAAVTIGLFLVMYKLVSSGEGERTQRDIIASIRFGPVEIPDEITVRDRRKPPDPPTPEELPSLPKMPVSRMRVPEQNLPRMDFPELDVPLVAGEGLFIGNIRHAVPAEEGDIIPIVVIRPMYPREAAMSGIEGWVKVEFTITESGTVDDPRVIESDPPRIFNREAIRAILKWKFKPRVVEGVAVPRRATQVIDFRLDDS